MEFHKDLCPENISTVRGLIDGTFKSEFNDNKNRGIYLLFHQYKNTWT